MPIQAVYELCWILLLIKFWGVSLTTNANLALCSLSAKMEEPMKEHHQIQSHMNATERQGLHMILQSGKMDNLNVCLNFVCMHA